MNAQSIFIRHNHIHIPNGQNTLSQELVATIMMNLSYYGYALNVDAWQALSSLSHDDLVRWWKEVEPEFKSLTGDDRNIGDFVVYKNFPQEVLSKTEGEYWFNQLLIYWGLPASFLTEEVKPREKMSEQPKLKVLQKAKKETLQNIFNSYLASPARWKEEEFVNVLWLADRFPIDTGKLVFKENLVRLAVHMAEGGIKIKLNSATDVLRLAVGMSDGDVSLKQKTKFKSLKKNVRRWLLSAMEDCGNLSEDIARRPEMWKRLFGNLHPGEFRTKYPKVCKELDNLYHDQLSTFNSQIEKFLKLKDDSVLELLSQRPGEFRRRLVHSLDLFGDKAVQAFTNEKVLEKLTTFQLVGIRRYLETVNQRQTRAIPPKGNWGMLKIQPSRHTKDEFVGNISAAISNVIAKRIPKVSALDDRCSMVKLPNNGQVGPYSRGTTFPIPNDVKFIRTASYWKKDGKFNTWFDNGWNFFDSNWNSVGACCWNAGRFSKYEKAPSGMTSLYHKHLRQASWGNEIVGAVFSGDPVNSKEMKGRAAQMIDLYPQELKKLGVRYAVWNILCYSRITFAQAEDVFAALQWGNDPNTGKLFEPSRCQLAFPLKDNNFTKYICVLDLETMEMVYIDANLKASVTSAAGNASKLQETMPAYMEYIRSLPSVYDLFRDVVDESSSGPKVLYSDADVELKDVKAYVFKPENKENKFKPIDLNSLL